MSLALIKRMVTPQRNWSRTDAFDAVFMLRVLFALVCGTVFGVVGIEGGWFFIFFLLANFLSANVWLGYQEVNIEEIEAVKGDDIQAPSLLMEGFGQSMPLFLVSQIPLLQFPIL